MSVFVLSDADVHRMAAAAGGRVVDVAVPVDKRWLFGLVRRRQMGYTVVPVADGG